MSEPAEVRFSLHQPILGALLLAALVLVTFSPLARAQFVRWDDRQTIAGNSSLNPATLRSVAAFWSPGNPQFDLYVPVTYTLWGTLAMISPRHAPDADGFTLTPAVFHLANAIMHFGAALLAWRILARLTRDELAALAGAAIFAVHPIQVEAVAWISGGKDVLSGLLGLLAIWMYIVFAQGRRRTHLAYAAATIAFVLATLAKPQAVAVPVVALSIDWLLLRRSPIAFAKSLGAWFAWCIPVILVGRHVQAAGLLDSPVAFRPIVALDAIAFYVGRIFTPFGLTVDYGRSPRWLIESADRFWTWIAPVALLVSGALLRPRARWPLAAFLMLVGALLPVLGLVGFDFQMFSTVADHYLYFAMLAPAFAIAMGAAALPRSKWPALAALVTIVCAALSFRQCAWWRDTQTLFSRAYEVNPTSLAAAGVLGMYYHEHGDSEQALGILAQSCQYHPTVPFAHFTYANVLQEKGLIAPAIDEYQRAIELDASKPEYFRNFGVALDKSGHPELALMAFEQGARLAPSDADNFQNAGLAAAKIGRIDEARKYFTRALELDPSRTLVREALTVLATTKPAVEHGH